LTCPGSKCSSTAINNDWAPDQRPSRKIETCRDGVVVATSEAEMKCDITKNSLARTSTC
jgi:hypothetical protein